MKYKIISFESTWSKNQKMMIILAQGFGLSSIPALFELMLLLLAVKQKNLYFAYFAVCFVVPMAIFIVLNNENTVSKIQGIDNEK